MAGRLSAGTDPIAGNSRSWKDAFLSSSLDCIIVMDARGTVREFNAASVRTFGFAPEEAIGQQLSDLMIPAELRARHKEGLARYLATGEGTVLGRRVEVPAVRKDGSSLRVELSISPFDAQGERLFIGYLRDLTEKQAGEAALARHSAIIHALQQLPIEAAHAPDLTAALRHCIRHACRLAGWPLGHALEVTTQGRLKGTGVWHVEGPESFEGMRAASAASESSGGEGLPGRALRSKKAEWVDDLGQAGFPLAEAAARSGLRGSLALPVLFQDRVVAVLEFFSRESKHPDAPVLQVLEQVGMQLGGVLERQSAQERLQVALEELRTANEARTRFMRTAVHELRTPLSPLAMQLDLLELRLPAGDEATAKGLALMRRNLQRLNQLIGELLDAARLEAHRVRIEMAEVDLADEVRRAAATYEQLAREQNVRLQVSVPASLRVATDGRRVAQALDNLVSNALKYTPAGRSVHISAGIAGQEVKVVIEDEGLGLSAAALAALFQPFSQVQVTRQAEGTGLGLYISRGYIEACGGRLEAASAGEGKGSAFTIALPLSQVSPSPSQGLQGSSRTLELPDMQALFSQAPVAIAVLAGPEHTYRFANRHYLAMVNRTHLAGKTYLQAFPELAGSPIVAILDRVYQTGEPFIADEMPLRLESAQTGQLEERVFKFNLEPLRSVQGVQGIMAVAVDITDLVNARKESASNELQLRHLIDSIPALAWTARPDGWIDFYNKRWYEYTGTTPAQMEGWGWQSVHDPHELPKVLDKWKSSILTGTPFEMSFPLRGADGRFRWHLTRVEPIRGAGGQVVRWFGTNTDVDDQVRDGRRLSSSLEKERAERQEAQRIARFGETFLTVLGHDLRNPLSASSTAGELILRLAKDDEAIARPARRILTSSTRMARMVDELLDFTRIRVGDGLVLAHAAVDLGAVGRLVASEHGQGMVEVVVSGDCTGTWDPAKLRQVLANLVSNALQHGTGPPVTLVVDGSDPGRVLVRVQNPGELPFDANASMDDPFGLGHGSPPLHRARMEAFGLGLYISHQVAKAHGGALRAVTRAGTTVFELSLPRRPASGTGADAP